MSTFKKMPNAIFYAFIISFTLLVTNCSTIKQANVYDKKITQKGVLLYFQEFFYFFPLKHKNIRTIQDLFTQNINQLNGFRCEGFLISVDTHKLLMNMKPSDVIISTCEYEEVKIQPNYFNVDDFRISLVKMTYEIDSPNPVSKTTMKKTIAYCIKIPESEKTVKFKHNYVPEGIYKIKILD